MKQERQEKNKKIQHTFRDRIFSNIDELLNELDLTQLPKDGRFCFSALFIDCVFLKLDLVCWDFNNCIFERNKFQQCCFDGTQFLRSTFTNCRFVECSLRNGSVPLSGLDTSGGGQTRLIELEMDSVIFTKCDLTEVYIKASELKQVEFHDSVLYGGDILNCQLSGISINRCILNAARFRGDYFWFCDISNSGVNEETYFDLPEDHKEYDAYKIYNQIYKLFKAQDLDDISIEYFFLAKKFEKVSSTKWYYRWWLLVLQYSCGYGEMPGRVVITSIVLIIAFAIIHGLHGLNFPGMEKSAWYTYIIKCLYYSSVTFTTLGDGEVSLDGLGMLLSSLESAFGVLLIAIGTASFYKKLTS